MRSSSSSRARVKTWNGTDRRELATVSEVVGPSSSGAGWWAAAIDWAV